MSSDKQLEKIKEKMLKKILNPTPSPSIWIDGEVVELTDANFHKAIAIAEKPVLVDFWADWCMPCKVMAPIINQMARDYSGKAYISKLNVDNNPIITNQYGVMSIPYFIVFKMGLPVGQTVGSVGKRGLNALLMRGF